VLFFFLWPPANWFFYTSLFYTMYVFSSLSYMRFLNESFFTECVFFLRPPPTGSFFTLGFFYTIHALSPCSLSRVWFEQNSREINNTNKLIAVCGPARGKHTWKCMLSTCEFFYTDKPALSSLFFYTSQHASFFTNGFFTGRFFSLPPVLYLLVGFFTLEFLHRFDDKHNDEHKVEDNETIK
jgi:hypothetical protein